MLPPTETQRLQPAAWPRWRAFLLAPVDGAGLLRLRVGLGLIVALSAARLLAYGWVTALYVAPSFHFPYTNFEWVRALPNPGMTAVVVLLGALGIAIALGVGGRAVVFICAGVFTYVELIDKAVYLNHYYLISLLLLHLGLSSASCLPLARHPRVPRYQVWGVRAQVALVYFFAGLWKLNPDWMLRAEPLSTWLWGFQELPVVGPLLALPATAFAMSWAGAAFDLVICILILWRPTSKAAFFVCVCFHTVLWCLFPIGVFSWVMILSASVLIRPNARAANPAPHLPDSCRKISSQSRTATLAIALTALFTGIQLLVPLRSLAHPGNVNWHEQGYRFSWRVMLNEKAAHVEVRTKSGSSGWRSWPIRRELTPLQIRQMGFQPDMLLHYAHHVCTQLGAPGGSVDVRIDARVAWNARRAVALIADTNLCTIEDVAEIILDPPS